MTAAAVTLCVVSMVCSLLFSVIPGTRMKKTANFVLGIFIISALALPLTDALSTLRGSDDTTLSDEPTYNEDEYIDAVAQETSDNLVRALDNLLLNEGIEVNNIRLSLRVDEDFRIYVRRVVIYISEDMTDRQDKIESIIYRNLSKEAEIVVEE